jgi:hypothetical protein
MKKVIVALLACLGLFVFAACGASDSVDLGSLESKIAGLQDRVSGLETENGQLKDGVSGLQIENGKLKDDIAALSGLEDGGLDDIEDLISDSQKRIEDLEKEVEGLKSGSTNPNQPFFDWDNPIVIDDFDAFNALDYNQFIDEYYGQVLQITGKVNYVSVSKVNGAYPITIEKTGQFTDIVAGFRDLSDIQPHDNSIVTIKGVCIGLSAPYGRSLDLCRIVTG